MIKKVLIVDDHPVIRFAVKMLLEKSGMEVVGETDNGIEAVQKSRELEPDLVLLDIGLPKIDGMQVLERLRSLALPMKILVLTSQAGAHFAQRCQQAGADGFVTKTDDLNDLLDAVRIVLKGYAYFPQSSHFVSAAPGKVQNEEQKVNDLSDRELSVLILTARGLGNKQIGEQLLLSEKTISTYKHRLKTKLNVTTLVEMIDFARRNNLLQ
ncbi:response regulator transcription factor [Cedecea neteri]|uniref:response regulator transcription factor n=1 Tax=Cedecea neteri TaxID=158822 RepID=UPI000A7A71F7|nr:response regulator transcription factor [Cedecea neteri]